MNPRRRRGSRCSTVDDDGRSDLEARKRAAQLFEQEMHDMLVPRKRRGEGFQEQVEQEKQDERLARALEGMSAHERQAYVASLTPQERVALLAALSPHERAEILAAMSPSDRAATLAEMSADERLSCEMGWDGEGDERFRETMVTTGGLSRSERFKAARDGVGAYGGTRAMLSMTLENEEFEQNRMMTHKFPADHPQAWIHSGPNAAWALDATYLRWCSANGIDPYGEGEIKRRMRFGHGIAPVTFPSLGPRRRASMFHIERLASTKTLPPPLRPRQIEVVPVPLNPWEMEFIPLEVRQGGREGGTWRGTETQPNTAYTPNPSCAFPTELDAPGHVLCLGRMAPPRLTSPTRPRREGGDLRQQSKDSKRVSRKETDRGNNPTRSTSIDVVIRKPPAPSLMQSILVLVMGDP